MAVIKSSSEHLVLNADGVGKDIKFQANGVEVSSISSAGAFTSTSIDATKLSGALPAIDGSALTGNVGIGNGQSWTDVKASRAVDNTYTNSTGKSIVVSITVNVVIGAATAVWLLVDGLRIFSITNTSDAYQTTLYAIVPNGSTYKYEDQSTTSPINYWHELR